MRGPHAWVWGSVLGVIKEVVAATPLSGGIQKVGMGLTGIEGQNNIFLLLFLRHPHFLSDDVTWLLISRRSSLDSCMCSCTTCSLAR